MPARVALADKAGYDPRVIGNLTLATAPALTMMPAPPAAQASADARGAIPIALLLIAITLAFAYQATYTFVGGTALCAVFLVIYRRLLRFDAEMATRGIIVLFLLCPAFFKPGHGFSPVFYVFSTAIAFLTALVISRFSAMAIHRAATIVYWFLAALVLMVLAIFWGSPFPFGEVVEGSSTNAIPAYMIIVQLLLCTTSFVVNGRAPILTPLLTFLIAFFGSGRGSLVVGGLIVGGSLIINLFPRNVSPLYRIALIALSLAAMAYLALNIQELYEYVAQYTKLSVGVVDENRLGILNDYLATITPVTFFLGSEYEGTLIDILYKGNPHISFIRTHSFFGIFGLLLAALSPLVVFFARAPWSVKFPLGFFVTMAVLRAATEPILFPTLLDTVYFLMIMLFFRARNAAAVLR